MNWTDAINNLDTSEKNTSWVDMSDFDGYLNLCTRGYSAEFSNRVKKYWITSWICTDTQVGLAVYCLDGEPVAVSSQNARKNDEDISFVSNDAYMKLFNFVISLSKHTPDIQDMSEEFDPWWFSRK